MKYSYSNVQMRAADDRAIASGVSTLTLMERAGKKLARKVRETMQEIGSRDALFVCGGGNNGGDGFVAARLLAEAGEYVEVLCLAKHFSPACITVKARYKDDVLGRIPRRRYALIVDCVFGTGLSRPPEGDEKMLIDFINNSGAYVISCDLPSGLTDGGIAYEPCVVADETLTIGLYKNALLLSDGADVSGKITVGDIGIDPDERGAEVWELDDVKQYFPKKKSNSHKGSYGSACIFAGGAFSGAAFLSAGACLKSGAGYTRLYVTEELYASAVGELPSCVLNVFRTIDEDILKANSIAIGMGMGVSEELYRLLTQLLRLYTGTLVLDADALNTLAVYGADVLKTKSCNVIMTPHPKEFSRLSGKSVKMILRDPIPFATEYARRYGVTLLLKSNRSVITDGIRVAINETGSPVLAKGGSGDVISGFLAGTAARHIPPYEAACTAAFVLGRVGELAAKRMGEYAPDPTDIIELIPRVLMEISESRQA